MISLLVVSYRSAALAAEAIRSAREATSERLQVVVVDNSCQTSEADALRPLCDELIVSPTNRGYAGAINDGRKRCDGDVLIVSNPDVRFGQGSIDALARTLNRRVPVAGPALFWDDAEEWILPPSELHTGLDVIDRALASRSSDWRRSRDRRRIRRRIAFWSLRAEAHVQAISGAVMAMRSDCFDELGGFDERFALYFEENDFVRRVQAARRLVAYVPGARCRHIYNQSAAEASSHAATAYAVSEERYLAKWNGPLAARVLKRLERPLPAHDARALDGPIVVDREGVVVEASPLPSFDTAAGHFARSSTIEVPPDVWRAFRGSALYLRVIDIRTAEILATYVRNKS